MIKLHAFPKWLGRLLVVGFVLLLVMALVLGFVALKTRDTAATLRQDIIAGCNTNNQREQQLDHLLTAQGISQAGITQTGLDQLISALEGSHPTKRIQALAAALEAQIHHRSDQSLATFKKALDKATAARDCAVVYSNVSGTAGREPYPRAKEAAVHWEIVSLKNWSGYCLTAASARAGTRVTEAPCSHSHDLWYDPASGRLTLAGHAEVAFGDSGGYLALKSSGLTVQTDSQVPGPGGFSYDRMWFGVRGTYWHANGPGRPVTMTSHPGSSRAVYYAWLGFGSNARSVI